MNSQIYCLPQKYGWNAIQCTSESRAEQHVANMKRFQKQATKKPFFAVKFNAPPPSDEVIQCFQSQYPKFKDVKLVSDQDALNAIYNSEYSFKYGPQFLPSYRMPLPPVNYELRADPLHRYREFKKPFSQITPPSYMAYDIQRGAYQWRNLVPKPGMYVWQGLEKIPALSNTGERSTILPARLPNHDPDHEKERWDNVRNLVRNNAVSYGYRTDVAGYTGHKLTNEHISSCVDKNISRPNPAMTSATHAYHRKFPPKEYCQPREIEMNRAEPVSRVVTLPQPQNPFSPVFACNSLLSPE